MADKGRINFYDQIQRNKFKSVILIIVIFVILIALTYTIGKVLSENFGYDFFTILIFGIIISIIYILVSYSSSDKIALASAGAKEASIQDYRQLHNIVEGLCLASGMPKPRVYIIPSPQINAFASGRDPKHSVIAITEGALKQLNKQELEGVIGHELSHIANYDIRFMTLAAVMIGMIAIISQIFLRSLWFGGRGNKKGNAILLVLGIILAILAPIAVQLVQLSISRKREYAADASSVKFTRSPTGLTSALKKIKGDSEKLKVSNAIAPLFISDPGKRDLSDIFATHPSIKKRIDILERM